MSKVIFTVKYEIRKGFEEEYSLIAKELKAIVKADGLLDYEIFQMEGRNVFLEIFTFESNEAYENYDDSDERLTLLLSKLSEMIVEGTLEYSTFRNYLD